MSNRHVSLPFENAFNALIGVVIFGLNKFVLTLIHTSRDFNSIVFKVRRMTGDLQVVSKACDEIDIAFCN